MRYVITLALMSTMAAGCAGVGSVYPIYTEKETVFLPELLGSWGTGEKEKDVAVIAQGKGHNAYTVKFRGDNNSLVELDVHLTKIGGKLFADAFVEECGTKEGGGMIMPVHMFAWLISTGPELKISGFNMEWLEGYLAKHPRAVRHLLYGQNGSRHNWIYFTDTTKHVRKFLKKTIKMKEAWVQDDQLVFKKISDSQELPPRPEKKEEAPEAIQGGTAK